jgi:mevalonate kinase
MRGRPIETFKIHTPFRLLIADTGIPSSTKVTVGDVRKGWQARPAHYEALFEQIGKLVARGRLAIEQGQVDQLGPLMTQHQVLLEELNVSCRPLERLIQAAIAAGASGAKLSGAGRGGNLITIVRPEEEARVFEALTQAGAAGVIATWVGRT